MDVNLESVCTCSLDYFQNSYLGDENIEQLIALKNKSPGRDYSSVISSWEVRYHDIDYHETFLRLTRLLLELSRYDENEGKLFLNQNSEYFDTLLTMKEELR